MKSPVLFIIFNRLETANQVFKKIRQAKPSRLYIAADGPRKNIPEERLRCDNVRDITKQVDWDCEVKTLFQEENLGCKLGVYTAINWFFKNEEEGIILEDDVVPKLEFFDFCNICLDKYRENTDIFSILGFNQFGQEINSNSYYYSRGYYAWGWASWRRSWENYKLILNKNDIIKLKRNKNYPHYVIKVIEFNLKLVSKNLLDTWDYQMIFQMITNDSYTIVPYANLTSNIGKDGAHSSNNLNIFHKYGAIEISNLVHPKSIADNIEMNNKLWKEYKDAYAIVFLKDILLKLGLYRLLRRIIFIFR